MQHEEQPNHNRKRYCLLLIGPLSVPVATFAARTWSASRESNLGPLRWNARSFSAGGTQCSFTRGYSAHTKSHGMLRGLKPSYIFVHQKYATVTMNRRQNQCLSMRFAEVANFKILCVFGATSFECNLDARVPELESL